MNKSFDKFRPTMTASTGAVSCPSRSAVPTRTLLTSVLLLLLLLSGCDFQVSPENRNLPFRPAVVAISPEPGPIRVVALGDFGWGGEGQEEVAAAIEKIHEQDAIDFGITLGDNFYHNGVTSTTDRKWKERWEEPYGSMGIPFYPSLGNHDYYGSVRAQLEYVSPSGTWKFPARQYRLRAREVEFFALDTMDDKMGQLEWLRDALNTSDAKWKVVYGHHPIYSAGNHGDNDRLEEILLPVIRGKVDVYVAGHDHDMQHLAPVDGTHFLVSGGGGARLRGLRNHPRLLFGEPVYGFTVLTFLADEIIVEMFGKDGEQIYRTSISKSSSPDSVSTTGANGRASEEPAVAGRP